MPMTEPTALTLWTVYDRPADYPRDVVVRAWDVPARGPSVPRTRCETFADVAAARRAMVSRGLACLGRMPDDDPKIVETWI